MTMFVDDFFSWVIPKPMRYVAQEIKDDITDLTLDRKVSRNIFRLSTSGTAIVIGTLLPTVIAPHTLGLYLNNLLGALLSIDNVIVLDALNVLLCSSILGGVSLVGSKELYRLYNKYLHGHTNSDYNFDDKRIQDISRRYVEQYTNIRLELIEAHVKQNINYMLALINEKRASEEGLSKNVKEYKKNSKPLEIISPKDPSSKADIKLMLALYTHGDDRAFKAHLSLYSKVQTLIIEHYTKPAITMCDLANIIEDNYPAIIPKHQIRENAEYLHNIERRENIAPTLLPLHPLFDTFENNNPDASYHFKDEKNDGAYVEEIPIYSSLDDEKTEVLSTTNPLTFLQPYLRQQTLEKRRASFHPTIKPKIDKEFAEELHHDIVDAVPKMEEVVKQADDKKNHANQQKRKTI
jgi:hypothetical protein